MLEDNFYGDIKETIIVLKKLSKTMKTILRHPKANEVGRESCEVVRVFKAPITTSKEMIVLEVVSESGKRGFVVPSLDFEKKEYIYREKIGPLTIIAAPSSSEYVFTEEDNFAETHRERMVRYQRKRQDWNLNIVIVAQLLILFYFHVVIPWIRRG